MRHVKLVHERLPFKCYSLRCLESFATQEEVDAHEAEAHPRMKCPTCNKIILKTHYDTHKKEIHDGERKVVCDICGNLFINMYTLKTHHEREHENTELECDICGRKARDMVAMRTHMRKHASGPQTCTVCGKVMANKKVLQSHSKIHSAPVHVCEICGKGFHAKRKLKVNRRDKLWHRFCIFLWLVSQEHSYIHSGVTDAYVCACGRGFRFDSSFCVHRNKCASFQKQNKSLWILNHFLFTGFDKTYWQLG